MGRNMIKSEKYIPTPIIVKIKSVWEWFLSRIPEWYGIAWQNYGNELWAQQSVFAVRLKVWVLSYTSSAPWRLWSDWVYAKADRSLHWAHRPFCPVTFMLIYEYENKQ